MRKALALPTLGMIGAYFLGLIVVVLWGMQVATTGSQVASEFFSALNTLFLSSIMGVVLLVLLIILTIRFWYIMVPFFLGVLSGLLLLAVLGSSLYTGITASMFRVIDGTGGNGIFRNARAYPLNSFWRALK